MGKVLQHRNEGKPLDFPGGYDEAGQVTTDVDTIIATRKLLPIGLWKGSGLALMLDLLASLLSQGQSTADIARGPVETGISQVFIAIRPQADPQYSRSLVETILAYTAAARPADPGQPVRYPGEGSLLTRQKNKQEGIPVNEKIWEAVLGL